MPEENPVPELSPIPKPNIPQSVPPVEPKKSSRNKWLIGTGIVLVILLGLGGYLYYKIFYPVPLADNGKSSTTADNKNSTSSATTPTTIKLVKCTDGKVENAAELCSVLTALGNKLQSLIPTAYTFKTVYNEGSYDWVLPNGDYITISGKNLYTNFDDSKGFLKESEVNKLGTDVESYFISQDFIKDSNNPANALEIKKEGTQTFYNGVFNAYQKSEIYCSVDIEYDAGTFSFSCGTHDSVTDSRRKEFETAVFNAEKRKIYFEVEKLKGDYANLYVRVRNETLIVKKQGTDWIVVWKRGAMQDPPCTEIDEHSVPRELFDTCY